MINTALCSYVSADCTFVLHENLSSSNMIYSGHNGLTSMHQTINSCLWLAEVKAIATQLQNRYVIFRSIRIIDLFFHIYNEICNSLVGFNEAAQSTVGKD